LDGLDFENDVKLIVMKGSSILVWLIPWMKVCIL
jgi:hypothetical protein